MSLDCYNQTTDSLNIRISGVLSTEKSDSAHAVFMSYNGVEFLSWLYIDEPDDLKQLQSIITRNENSSELEKHLINRDLFELIFNKIKPDINTMTAWLSFIYTAAFGEGMESIQNGIIKLLNIQPRTIYCGCDKNY